MQAQGCHIILTRDDARRLFAADGDEAVRKVVQELLLSKKKQAEGLMFNCGEHWNAIHRCLTDGTLDPDGGEFPLNHCILGGRQLYNGPEFEAVLVRPDIVPHVAESLHRIKRVDVREAYLKIAPEDYGRQPTDDEFDQVWGTLLQIRQLFEDAAENREAVLFAVAHKVAAP